MVSSTAAATLRQLVMFVVDKMVLEDRISEHEDIPASKLTNVRLPDGTTIRLGPSAQDAFSVFEDLCLLANSEKPHFLKLEFLHKTFALELIESVLTNYHELFRKVRRACVLDNIQLIYCSSTENLFSSCNIIYVPFSSNHCLNALNFPCRFAAHESFSSC